MKKKSLTYILVLAALGIWIYVFYFIFSAVSGNDTALTIRSSKRTVDTTVITQEKYTLLLNYSDPFLKNRQTAYVERTISSGTSSSSGPQSGKITVQKMDQKKIDLAKANEAAILFCKTVSFAGSIRNNATNKNIAILTIEDKEYMMSAGESINGVTLLKIVSDSVEIKCLNRKMYIKKGK